LGATVAVGNVRVAACIAHVAPFARVALRLALRQAALPSLVQYGAHPPSILWCNHDAAESRLEPAATAVAAGLPCAISTDFARYGLRAVRIYASVALGSLRDVALAALVTHVAFARGAGTRQTVVRANTTATVCGFVHCRARLASTMTRHQHWSCSRLGTVLAIHVTRRPRSPVPSDTIARYRAVFFGALVALVVRDESVAALGAHSAPTLRLRVTNTRALLKVAQLGGVEICRTSCSTVLWLRHDGASTVLVGIGMACGEAWR
jgi:hypothetical protein